MYLGNSYRPTPIRTEAIQPPQFIEQCPASLPELPVVDRSAGGSQCLHDLLLHLGARLDALQRCYLLFEKAPCGHVTDDAVGFVIRRSLDNEHERTVADRHAARQNLSFALQLNHVLEMGKTVPSSRATACSGDAGNGPRAPSTRYCMALLPAVTDTDLHDCESIRAALGGSRQESDLALISRHARSTSTRNGCSSIFAISKTSHCFCSATSNV